MSNRNADFAAELKVGDLVAVRSMNVAHQGCVYHTMQVVKVMDTMGALALEGTLTECNLFCRTTGTIVGQRDRYVEPVTAEVRAANQRAKVGNWAWYHAEHDIRRLPAEDQAKVYELVQALQVGGVPA